MLNSRAIFGGACFDISAGRTAGYDDGELQDPAVIQPVQAIGMDSVCDNVGCMRITDKYVLYSKQYYKKVILILILLRLFLSYYKNIYF